MSIDTEIKGDPGSLRSAASNLSGSLGPAVSGTADAFASASRSPGWDGLTASAFASWASSAASQAGDVEKGVTKAARGLVTFAEAMQAAQRAMGKIRDEASGAGLEVSGFEIQDPGPGPGNPGALPKAPAGTKVSSQTLARHGAALAAYEEHLEKKIAYDEAEKAAREVRSDYDDAADALGDTYSGLKGAGWFFAGVDLAVGAVTGYGGAQAERLRDYYADRRDDLRRRIREDGYDARRVDHEQLEREKAGVRAGADEASKWGRRAIRAGGALNAISATYEITQGKDPEEAIAAGAGGFAGGVAGGAALGAVAGPPGALLGGAIGGIVGSGTAEGIVKEGLSGLDNGVDAVVETGGAVVTGIGKGIGKGAEVAGGALKDVGGALNPFD